MSIATKGSILYRAGPNENQCVMSGCSLSRQLGFGTAWTHIRVGIRYNMRATIGGIVNLFYSGFQTGGSPTFGLGFCTGNSPLRNSLGTYFVGAVTRGGEWFATDQGSQDYVFEVIDVLPATAVAGVFTLGTTFAAAMKIGAGAESATKFLRSVFFVDLIKNGGNFDIKIFYTPSPHTAPADKTRTEFLTQMKAATPTFVNYFYTAAQSVMNEQSTYGDLNALNIFYGRGATEIELQDIAMARLV